MGSKSALLAWTVLVLCLTVPSGAHDLDVNTDHTLYDLFWTIFWLSTLGFLIYLLCTYPIWDWTAAPRPRCPEQEPVINVRIINPLRNDG
jgi:hypothetical protein